MDEALERVATVTQRDNPQQIKWIAPRYLSVVEVLDGLDVIDGTDHVEVVLADGEGAESTVQLEPEPLTMAHSRREFDDLVVMNEDATASLPFYQRDMQTHYWFEYLADEQLVYFQFNSVTNDDEGESLAEFSKRLFEFIDRNKVDALVIDVRLNHGGNNFLVKPIIDGVIRSDKINQRGHLFVIIGRETFSACQNFCNRLQFSVRSNAMFVGEPTGSRPNFVGEGNKIKLPYSGLIVNGSSLYWQDTLSDDFRIWIAPDLAAPMTSEDFRTNRDPCLDVIRAYRANLEADERAARSTN